MNWRSWQSWWSWSWCIHAEYPLAREKRTLVAVWHSLLWPTQSSASDYNTFPHSTQHSAHVALLRVGDSVCVGVCVSVIVRGKKEKGRWDALPPALSVRVWLHVCMYMCFQAFEEFLAPGVEGVLICHLALQVKLESSESVRGRGINNTKGLQIETEREEDSQETQRITLSFSKMSAKP